jgi:hypothetical protein
MMTLEACSTGESPEGESGEDGVELWIEQVVMKLKLEAEMKILLSRDSEETWVGKKERSEQ